ncbi:MAG: acyltransferase [Desulfoprunum sp.]|uniref:acyltransferase n=1 Tax=Desulfoprunum sp. TaxID=2020866 RepID=UPI003C759D62
MKNILKRAIFVLCFLFISPLFFLYRLTGSRSLFAGQAQALALVPGKLGSYLRVAYYCMTLRRCSSQGYIGFGSFFAHPEAELGIGYYIGAYTIIGKVLIGNHATIASHVSILSGKNQHGFKELGKPIQEQFGFFSEISIGENCWIGNNSVVMADLGRQTIVAAGSVVVSPTQGEEVVAGNPARVVKKIN